MKKYPHELITELRGMKVLKLLERRPPARRRIGNVAYTHVSRLPKLRYAGAHWKTSSLSLIRFNENL